jgi:hypothetical protein
MGLAEEKIKVSFQNKVKAYTENMEKKDYQFHFDADWSTFSEISTTTCDNAGNICGQMASMLTQISINLENDDYLMTWNAMKAQFNKFVVKHADFVNEYEYKLEIKNKVAEFTANTKTFVFSSSSSANQKTIRETLEAIL